MEQLGSAARHFGDQYPKPKNGLAEATLKAATENKSRRHFYDFEDENGLSLFLRFFNSLSHQVYDDWRGCAIISAAALQQ